jgi:hypothetical protein
MFPNKIGDIGLPPELIYHPPPRTRWFAQTRWSLAANNGEITMTSETRRSILIGAIAALMCAPAIVRATSLMPVRGLPLQFWSPLGEFYRNCFYHSLDHGLRTGRMIASINGKIVSVADARRMVAYARAQGWLTPEPKAGDSRDLAHE